MAPTRSESGGPIARSRSAVIEAFKSRGVRVIHGSPGCVGKIPAWVKTASGAVEDLNLNLCNLRNLGIGMAREENVGFCGCVLADAQGRGRWGSRDSGPITPLRARTACIPAGRGTR